MADTVPLVARVLPDIRSSAKTFDYLVPDAVRDQVRVGTLVRIPLGPRRERGWVVALGVEPPEGVVLRPLAKVTGWGPPADIVELARWTAWRWGGHVAPVLVTASPPGAVAALPAPPRRAAPIAGPFHRLADDALAGPCRVLRLPPADDPYGVVLAACARGNALVVMPSADHARALAARLRRAGVPVALHPRDWALGAAGATVVGTRTVVFAPVADLAAVVVLDEHDEALQEEQTITWHARDVAVERARRAGVPCVLVSPVPSLEALDHGPLVVPSRTDERSGWPILEVVDRNRDDPRETSLLSSALFRHLQAGARVVCILNTTGRARLLACATCAELARCERCHAAVGMGDDGRLSCRRCGAVRPAVCAKCGGTRLKLLRPGTARLREELAAASGTEVVEITSASVDAGDAQVVVGTEAALHRVAHADVVAFLDVDQELLAPRYRAAEQAMALLARAARVVGPRAGGGRLLVQTRLPRHEVLDAVLHADPGRLVSGERARRAALRFPPSTALAQVTGASAGAFIEAFGRPGGVAVLGPADGAWLLRAAEHTTLCDALAATPRPPGRLRIAVDPTRV